MLQLKLGSTCTSQAYEDINVYRAPKSGWTLRALVVDGKQFQYAANGTKVPGTDDAVDEWCLPKALEALYFPTGGLVSPIHLFPKALTLAQLQLLYYENAFRFETL